MKILLLLLCFLTTSAFAIEFTGTVESYKPAEHSSYIRNRMNGDAAREFYHLMDEARETNRPDEKLTIRESSNMECLNFYGDNYFECRFNMNAAGEIQAGY